MKNNTFQWLSLTIMVAVVSATILMLTGVVESPFKIGGGSGGGVVPPNDEAPTYTPPEASYCSAYNIGAEYGKAYGAPVVAVLANNCLAVGGVWTNTNNEFSCYWNPAVETVDCDDATIRNYERFCELGLKASYTCDNTIAYAGCECDKAVPSDWPVADGGDDGAGDEGSGDGPEGGTFPHWTIFVTHNSWSGASGGLGGLDAKCTFVANTAGLGGQWFAVASSGGTPAIARLNDGTYWTTTDMKVADSLSDLFDGTIDSPVNINENGDYELGFAWTGTMISGAISTFDCHEWGWVDALGTFGDNMATDGNWINAGVAPCDVMKHIYCTDSPIV